MGPLTFIEYPLVLFVAVGLSLSALLTWNDAFISPYMKLLKWENVENNRLNDESTYYKRICKATDVTTYNANDLFVNQGATCDQAYDTFLEHGFAVFEDVIPKPIASELRDHIIEENLRVDPFGDMGNLLHAPHRRWLADALHPSDHPSISNAMQSVANQNPVLVETLERALGPNPAIVEMNAITSAPGAWAQKIHSDGSESLLRNSRSFSPTHVLLMQLQDTYLEMGPTQVCPGTHMCTDLNDAIIDYCDDYGIFVTNSSGILPGGSAILMNTNALHRGTEYTWFHDWSEQENEERPHRVMFVITLAPQPLARAESRQIMHGLSFSMHWSLFGYTLRDFGKIKYSGWLDVIDKIKNRKLLARGYTLPDLLLQRMANFDRSGSMNPYSFRRFMEEGGTWWWPNFLMGDVGYNPDDYELETYWTDFFLATAQVCDGYIRRAIAVLTAVYGIQLISTFRASHDSCYFQQRRQAWASLTRMISMSGFFWLLITAVLQHGRGTAMMRDLKAGMLAQPYFPNREGLYSGPSAMPNTADLMVESRLGSEHLYMHNDQIEWHPGNRYWKEMVSDYRPVYQSLPPALRLGVAELMLDEFQYSVDVYNQGNDSDESLSCVHHAVSRILYQSPSSGDWQRVTPTDAISYANQELRLTPGLAFLTRQLRFVDSECVYGFRRHTALCQRHASTTMHRFVPSWLRVELSGRPKDGVKLATQSPPPQNVWSARASLAKAFVTNSAAVSAAVATNGESQRNWRPVCETTTSRQFQDTDGDPYAHSLVAGDLALVAVGDLRYQVKIERIDSSGRFHLKWGANRIPTVDTSSYENILPFTPLEIGDLVKLEIEEELHSMVTNMDDNGEKCILDDHRRVTCDSLVRILNSKFFAPGAAVLGYYQDSVDEADFGWYEAVVRNQHHQLQPEYVDIEWYDGTREAIHFRLLRKWTTVRPSEHVGMSWSNEVGEVARTLRRNSEVTCAIKRLEDDSGYLHLVPCSELRRWPYSPPLEMEEYNLLMAAVLTSQEESSRLNDEESDNGHHQPPLHQQSYPHNNIKVTAPTTAVNGTRSEVGNRPSNSSTVIKGSDGDSQLIHHRKERSREQP